VWSSCNHNKYDRLKGTFCAGKCFLAMGLGHARSRPFLFLLYVFMVPSKMRANKNWSESSKPGPI
jgi:hypothetical protein